MYGIDVTHFLDANGAIALMRGSAQAMADFLTAVVARASDFDRLDDVPGAVCFGCHKRDPCAVEIGISESDAIVRRCFACGTEGRISNWRGMSRDVSQGAARARGLPIGRTSSPPASRRHYPAGDARPNRRHI